MDLFPKSLKKRVSVLAAILVLSMPSLGLAQMQCEDVFGPEGAGAKPTLSERYDRLLEAFKSATFFDSLRNEYNAEVARRLQEAEFQALKEKAYGVYRLLQEEVSLAAVLKKLKK